MADEDVAVPRTLAGLVGACVSPAGGVVVPAVGASATSWPMLTAAFPAAVATRVPVAPVALRLVSGGSSVTLNVPAFEDRSARSVMPEGGAIVVANGVPKKASSCTPDFVVTIAGAVTDVDAGLARPPTASTGVTEATLPYVMIVPAAACEDVSPTVYDAGSLAPRTRVNTACRMVVPLVSTRTCVQPVGGWIVGAPRDETASTATSPALPVAGAGMVSVAAVRFAA